MRYRITANTQHGKYVSIWFDADSPESLDQAKNLIRQTCESGTRLEFKVRSDKTVYLSKNVCQNSVFEIEVEE